MIRRSIAPFCHTAVRAAVLVALISFLSQLASAGRGGSTINGGVKELDFAVSVRFNPTTGEMTKIKDAFTGGNEILADATDGNFVFDEICLITGSQGSRHAEVYINPSGGRAYATVDGYGTPGRHIMLFYDDNIDYSSAWVETGNHYTVAHEFGHQVWGILDEYSGPNNGGDCEAEPGIPAASFCLMDNYYTRGGNMGGPGTYTLNELCTEVVGNHDPDSDTYQEARNHQSCWETIDEHPTRSAPKPEAGGVPTLPDQTAPSVSAPIFTTASGIFKIGIVADRSGSMGGTAKGETKINLAKQGARLFVDLLDSGESIAVASFASNATTDLAMTTISGDTERTQAKAAINGWVASGLTALGSGVIEGRDEILSTGTTCVQALVVLSDGAENVAPFIDSVKQSLIDADISVFSIAIGNGKQTQEMADLADDTQGKFYHVKDASYLPGLLAMIEGESKGDGMLAREPDDSVPQSGSDTHTVYVDDASSEIAFVLSWVHSTDHRNAGARSRRLGRRGIGRYGHERRQLRAARPHHRPEDRGERVRTRWRVDLHLPGSDGDRSDGGLLGRARGRFRGHRGRGVAQRLDSAGAAAR
jgi:hypothetical protein